MFQAGYPEDIKLVLCLTDGAFNDADLGKNTPRVAPMADSFAGLLTAKRRLEVAFNDQRIKFQFGSVTMLSELIMGSPPNFLQLLPKDEAIATKVDVFAPELDLAVRRVKGIAHEGSGIVRLVWAQDSMTVSAKADEKEGEATIKVKASSEGRTAMNYTYLLEYLRGKEGVVTIGTQTERSPVLFRYRSTPLVLVMPMHVEW